MSRRGWKTHGVDGRPLEKTVVDWCCRLYETFGCAVYRIGQAPRRTKQTPGLPDLLVFHPESGAWWWHEVKRDGTERATRAEVEFAQRAEACGQKWYCGDLEEATAILLELGIAERRADGSLKR